MKNNSVITSLLAVTGAFFTGVTIGVLMAPKSGKENRAWLKKQSKELSDWLDQQSKEMVQETEERIRHIKIDVKNKIKDTIPDLYEATEDIQLSEDELIERENDRT